MARVCDITGKKTVTGHSRRHKRGSAGGVSGTWSRKAQATKRTFKPNIRKAKVRVAGEVKKVKVSMKAYKKLKKQGMIVQ